MLGFNAHQLQPVEKHVLYYVTSAISLTGNVPSQTEIAEQLTQYYGELVTSTSVGNYIQKLKQLGLLVKKGKWGAVGSSVTITPAVAAQVTEWFRNWETGFKAR